MKSGIALLALLAFVFSAPIASAAGKKVKVEKTTGKIQSITAADKDGNETVTILVGGKNDGHPVKLTGEWFEPWLKSGFDPVMHEILPRDKGRAPHHHYGTLLFAGRKQA